MPDGLLTAAERSMIENHKRVNETGQAMNGATACVSLSPLSPGMNCFIMIKDKTGVNDTFTFPPSKGNLTQSRWKQCFHASHLQQGRTDAYRLMKREMFVLEKCHRWGARTNPKVSIFYIGVRIFRLVFTTWCMVRTSNISILVE